MRSSTRVYDTASAETGRAVGTVRLIWLRIRRARLVSVAAAIFLALVLASVLAPVLTDADPVQASPMNRLQKPSVEHPLGTDGLGRDVYARVLYGGRLSLRIAAGVSLVTTISGVLIGAAAAFSRLDNLLMRVLDGLMAFPAVLLAIALVSALGPSVMNVVVALSVVYGPRTARIVRSSLLSVREHLYIEAARAMGRSEIGIVIRHALPNVLAPILVQATYIFAYSIQVEAALSFLGVGTSPEIPSWGNILSEGRSVIRQAPWLSLYPGLVVVLTTLVVNLLGDGLRDWLDPKIRRRISS